MALGKGKPKQVELFIPAAKLVRGLGHPFYAKLNEVLLGDSRIARMKDGCTHLAYKARQAVEVENEAIAGPVTTYTFSIPVSGDAKIYIRVEAH